MWSTPAASPHGLGGEHPTVTTELAAPARDRVLCHTDGVIEERDAEGEFFGEERLIRCANAVARARGGEGMRLGSHVALPHLEARARRPYQR
ncbi:SpoIIE family protein phosphatase [Streptomyces sp. NPDC058335]|uniref:SpoIIE family protein phosphatase n=1 Tax=Streptomyces sp. NPDC058335 TaxID=3346451 RepID=UPI003668E207